MISNYCTVLVIATLVVSCRFRCYRLKLKHSLIAKVMLLLILMFTVDVDYSLSEHVRELKIVRLPSGACLCKCFGDCSVLFELKLRQLSLILVPGKKKPFTKGSATVTRHKTWILWRYGTTLCDVQKCFHSNRQKRLFTSFRLNLFLPFAPTTKVSYNIKFVSAHIYQVL